MSAAVAVAAVGPFCFDQVEFASRVGYLLKKYSPQEVYDLAHHMNNTLTTEPLDRKEVDTVFCSILKRELRK